VKRFYYLVDAGSKVICADDPYPSSRSPRFLICKKPSIAVGTGSQFRITEDKNLSGYDLASARISRVPG
jgi:hypothetical protein